MGTLSEEILFQVVGLLHTTADVWKELKKFADTTMNWEYALHINFNCF